MVFSVQSEKRWQCARWWVWKLAIKVSKCWREDVGNAADTKRPLFSQPFIYRTKRHKVETISCMNLSQIDVVNARNSAHGLTQHSGHLLHGVNKWERWLGLHQRPRPLQSRCSGSFVVVSSPEERACCHLNFAMTAPTLGLLLRQPLKDSKF